MKHIISFKMYEENQYNPAPMECVQISYWLTGDIVPVKILKVNNNNTYLVSFNVDGSSAKGAPDAIIKSSDIIAPYKNIRTPVGSGFVSSNTNMQVKNNVAQVSNDLSF